MTGVTVHLGHDIASARTHEMKVLAAVVGIFVLGSILGRSVVELATARKLRTAAGWVLGIEALLVLGVAIAAQPRNDAVAMSLCLAAAMGLQTAALTRVGALTVHTTFVTGMLNKLAQLVSHVLFLTFGDRPADRDRGRVLRDAAFIFSVWLCYLAGAASGALLRSVWQTHTLFVPAAIIAGTAAYDWANPLSIEEERDRSER